MLLSQSFRKTNHIFDKKYPLNIPFVSLKKQHNDIEKQLISALQDVLENSSFILGNEVDSFEKKYATYSGTKYCIGIGNGTDALKISLRALDLNKDDEVILPVNSFIATAMAVTAVGAKPVFSDIDENTLNLSVTEAKKHLSKDTKVIVPVHLYGTPCSMDNLLEMANNQNIHVVEDNAQAQGATWNEKKTGSFGLVNATSFYPTKNLGALGDAGAITTDSFDIYKKACLLRNMGSSIKYLHESDGYNSRLDSLQAAFLSIKIDYLDRWNEERQKIASRYKSNLLNCKHIRLPQQKNSVYHILALLAEDRNELAAFLLKKNIQTLVHYPIPIHLQPAFKYLGYAKGDFPIAEQQAQELISLPLYIGMSNEEIDYVCENVIKFYN